MSKNKRSKTIIYAVFVFAIIIPLINLFTYVNISDAKELFAKEQFSTLIINSLSTTLLATLISVFLAIVVAWSLHRSNVKFKNTYSVLLTVPMLIPSISHAIGLIILLGNNGIITSIFNLNINLFGFTGIVLGSILYSFPVAFLLLNDAFSYEDYTTYEAADILGIPRFEQFMQITLPNISKPLVAATFAVFTMIFTDYGVPLMIGGKFQTLSAYMYREIIGLLNFSNGAVIGVLLLIPAFIVFFIDVKMEKGKDSNTVVREFEIKESKSRDVITNIVLAVVSILLILPIVAFVVLSVVTQFPQDLSLSLIHFQSAGRLGVFDYLLNSLLIALSTALVGTLASYLIAYVTSRSEKKASTMLLHLLSMFSLAIPGVVLGLSYVLMFNGTIIYNTVFILVLVNIVHFFSSPYLMAYNSFNTFSKSFDDLGETYGISRWRMLVDVFIPNMELTIFEMFSYFFTNAMITISAVSFLSNVRNQPLALLIPQLDSQSLIEPTALVSLIILVTNVIFKIVIYYVKKKNEKEVQYESKSI